MVEEGNPGIAGADCTAGTAGRENKSLNVGRDVAGSDVTGTDVAAPGYAACPVSARVSDEADGLVDVTLRSSGGVLAGTVGVTAFTSWG